MWLVVTVNEENKVQEFLATVFNSNSNYVTVEQIEKDFTGTMHGSYNTDKIRKSCLS